MCIIKCTSLHMLLTFGAYVQEYELDLKQDMQRFIIPENPFMFPQSST